MLSNTTETEAQPTANPTRFLEQKGAVSPAYTHTLSTLFRAIIANNVVAVCADTLSGNTSSGEMSAKTLLE